VKARGGALFARVGGLHRPMKAKFATPLWSVPPSGCKDGRASKMSASGPSCGRADPAV